MQLISVVLSFLSYFLHTEASNLRSSVFRSGYVVGDARFFLSEASPTMMHVKINLCMIITMTDFPVSATEPLCQYSGTVCLLG